DWPGGPLTVTGGDAQGSGSAVVGTVVVAGGAVAGAAGRRTRAPRALGPSQPGATSASATTTRRAMRSGRLTSARRYVPWNGSLSRSPSFWVPYWARS